jgi:DNA-binding transcriptional ArsR family regulator
MPRLSQTATAPTRTVEFVLSVPLDLMNAMYFTHLAADAEGLDGWTAETRRRMDSSLVAEMDFLYTFPKGEEGVLAWLGDNLWAHPEAWKDVPGLIAFVRGLPAGLGQAPRDPGIQGLVFQAACSGCGTSGKAEPGDDPRSQISAALRAAGIDPGPVLALYDRPEELRERLARVIERFFEEHYRPDLPRRLACLERSVAAHRGKPVADVVELTRRLSRRPSACLEDVCPGPFDRYLFAPSLDMGPYISCAEIGTLHGLFYPCEAEFIGAAPVEAEEARLARVYKALGDEHRLRILRLLSGREMYAQEIVERTGLHQPVVSRHLTFMKAVGLVTARRQDNMKFFALNPRMREELEKTLELFTAAEAAG